MSNRAFCYLLHEERKKVVRRRRPGFDAETYQLENLKLPSLRCLCWVL